MVNVSSRSIFALAVVLLIGWGIFFLLYMQTAVTQMTAEEAAQVPVVIPPSVRLTVTTDKPKYHGGDTVQISVINNSRVPIWLPDTGTFCPSGWWTVERLSDDGVTWATPNINRPDCNVSDIVLFPKKITKTDEWSALVVGPQIGTVMIDAPHGTYRIALKYIKGKDMTKVNWISASFQEAYSPLFNIE